MSEANNAWRVQLDGHEYEVELVHGTISGSRQITVNGVVVDEGRKFFDTGSRHAFDLGGHSARVDIDVVHSGFAHESTLHVDERYVEPLAR
ncbi:MAG: hypothetical protein Q7T56_07845 [Nocardioidaceae bacterium]|nr:hypothetical protein [Nocardioidaceae bacterium]